MSGIKAITKQPVTGHVIEHPVMKSAKLTEAPKTSQITIQPSSSLEGWFDAHPHKFNKLNSTTFTALRALTTANA